MGGWKIKLLYTLLIFAAGFTTAVYTLAPATGIQETVSYEDGGSYEDGKSYEDGGSDTDSGFNSEKAILIVKMCADKFVDFAKVTAHRTNELIKQKMAERRQIAKQAPG